MSQLGGNSSPPELIVATMGGRRFLTIAHVNVRSILANTCLLDLEILAASNAIDVLCVSETWLSDTCAKPGSPCVNLPGFLTPFRCDRIGNCRG